MSDDEAPPDPEDVVPDDLVETAAIGSEVTEPSEEEVQRHIEHITEQLPNGRCVEWKQLSLMEQQMTLVRTDGSGYPIMDDLFDSLQSDGWAVSDISILDDQITIRVEKVPDMGNRITLDECDDCGDSAIAFGERVENHGLADGKRVYCTSCGAEWTVSFKINACERGCCPFDREITLDPVYSEEQKIGPASDEYDSITLVRGLEPDAKIEFYQRTRPDEKVTVWTPDEAPDQMVENLEQTFDHENTASWEERVELWEGRLGRLGDGESGE